MSDTQLIRFLKSLSQTEIRQFREFINSPYYNKNKNLIRLFEIHCKYSPEFDIQDMPEEKIFGMIFGKEKFEYFKYKNLASDLFALGKEFLFAISLKKYPGIKEKYLLTEFRERNLDTAYEKTFKQLEKKLENTKVKDENYFLHKFDLKLEQISYYAPKKPNVYFNLFQERLDLFVNYSLITLLKIYNTMLHEMSQNNYNFDMKMFGNVMDFLGANEKIDNPTLMTYYLILQLEKTRDEKYFYLLKEYKNKYYDELSEYDNYMVYLHLDSYCATAFNEHCRTDLLKEQFILLKDNSMIDHQKAGKILYPDFLNEVKKAARVNEYEWAETYIERNKIKLNEEKDNTLNFCYGYLSYCKGQSGNALDFFSKANFSNYILKIQVKIHLLQISVDMQYYEQALLMIDTFRRYLTREKLILDSIRVSVLEFLKITTDLIKINSDIQKADRDFKINKLKEEIENMTNNRFGIKLWLREKAAGLIAN